MEPISDTEAWLEEEGAAGIPINGALSIGRGPANTLVLRTDGISRCHAVVHAQSNGEFWLVDLGSRNGTWHNDHRILQPVRLQNGDRVAILKHRFIFRQSQAIDESEGTTMLPTISVQQTSEVPFWLLISDIENFTGLSQSLSGQELAAHVGKWLQECQGVVEPNGGRINKYLGDGFFAVWPDTVGSEEKVLEAIRGLGAISAKGKPAFRMVVHRGIVSVGSSPLLAEESFIGSEVNFTFRMEKLAGSLGLSQLFSEAAAAKLSPLLPLRPLPAQQLKGFAAEYNFFARAQN